MSFSEADCIKLRSSWADVMALNHFRDQNFVSALFLNMLQEHPNLQKVFREQYQVEEQQSLFSELIKFIMMYLHDPSMLEECMDEFIRENPTMVTAGELYLESMGSVFIKTLRQSLGSEKFHPGMETLWIKLYIYLANAVLQSDVSDADSLMSALAPSTSSEKETPPLNCKSFSSPVPTFESFLPSKPTQTLNIDLAKEKYRGFRRSVNEASRTKVSVEVPASLTSSPTESTFGDNEPYLTPRSSRRNSALQLQELGLSVDNLLLQNEPFDPRRKPCHRRMPSDSSFNMESPPRKVSESSCDTEVSDVDDHLHMKDEMDFNLGSERRLNVFDHNSFGIKGLAPIAESEDDEASFRSSGQASSHYEALSRKSSEDEVSSRNSSLSLHHLDNKSSVSSGSAYTEKPMAPARSGFLPPTFSSPYIHSYLSSVPSLASRGSGQRALMGFMRTSYVLKKEMNNYGFNLPENTAVNVAAVQPTLRSTTSMVQIPYSRSEASLPSQNASLKKMPTVTKPAVNATCVKTRSHLSLVSTALSKEGRSLRKSFSRLFGFRKEKSPVPSPLAMPETLHGCEYSQIPSSILPSLFLARVSSAEIRQKYTATTELHSDRVSTYTVDNDNRLIFSRKPKQPKNKYLVKKVPHKIIYLKDIIN